MIKISKDKLNHCIGVARMMKKLAEEKGWSEQMCMEFTLGYLHDIGYEFSKNPEEHPIKGGLLLKHQGYKYWQEVFWHGCLDTNYTSESLDLLNIAHLQVDSKGNIVTVKERLEDIKNKYGKESKQYIQAKKLALKLKLL